MVIESRPPLTPTTTPQDFRDFYWLRAELLAFCRAQGLSTHGGKIEVAARIEAYLAHEPLPPVSAARKRVTLAEEIPLTPDTIIHEGFVCTQRHRAFFKQMIGDHFHFSTAFQAYFQNNVGKRYQDAIDAWHEAETRKKQGERMGEIAPQFEYNRFMRAYFSDPAHAGKTRTEAIHTWREQRRQRQSAS